MAFMAVSMGTGPSSHIGALGRAKLDHVGLSSQGIMWALNSGVLAGTVVRYGAHRLVDRFLRDTIEITSKPAKRWRQDSICN